MSDAHQPEFREPRSFTLDNGRIRAVITDLGARLTELWVADREGVQADIALGRPSTADLFDDDAYLGATVGRFANRIRDGRFTLDGIEYQLGRNEGAHHLHGGANSYDRRLWTAEPGSDGMSLRLHLVSEADDGGYPGTLQLTTEYALDDSALRVTMTATTDAPTIVNLANHAYFNLGGHASGDVLAQIAQIDGDFYTPVDGEGIPSGEVLAVAGTPFDFTTPKPLGADLDVLPDGYDHNWVLRGTGYRRVASFWDPASGRALTLSTDQPGVQLYTAGKISGVSAKAPLDAYAQFAGFTLETQTFPDAPNRSHFPAATLLPGETYVNVMHLSFGVHGDT